MFSQRNECSPKAVWKKMLESFIWGGRELYKRIRGPFLKCLGTLRTSGYSARQCQNQNWKPDPLVPLSFSQDIYTFFKRNSYTGCQDIKRTPALFPSNTFHRVLAACHLFFLSWGFSLLGTICPEVRPLQAHTRPFSCARPTLLCHSGIALRGELRRFLLFYFF